MYWITVPLSENSGYSCGIMLQWYSMTCRAAVAVTISAPQKQRARPSADWVGSAAFDTWSSRPQCSRGGSPATRPRSRRAPAQSSQRCCRDAPGDDARARIEAAAPAPLIDVGWHAGADPDRPDLHIAIENLPAFAVAVFRSAAGEGGHGGIEARGV